jgi:hypothetical protein
MYVEREDSGEERREEGEERREKEGEGGEKGAKRTNFTKKLLLCFPDLNAKYRSLEKITLTKISYEEGDFVTYHMLTDARSNHFADGYVTHVSRVAWHVSVSCVTWHVLCHTRQFA